MFHSLQDIIVSPPPLVLMSEQIFIRPTLTGLFSHLSVVAELGWLTHQSSQAGVIWRALGIGPGGLHGFQDRCTSCQSILTDKPLLLLEEGLYVR